MNNKRKDDCASRIRLALIEKGMKQSDLVRITGLSKSAISQYLSGKHEPKQTPVYLISKALDVSEAWLMGFDVPKTRAERIKTVVTKDEKELLDSYNELSDTSKDTLKKYIQFLKNTQ